MINQNKYLVILVDFDGLDNLFTTWKNHLKIFDKNFKNIAIINTHNLKFASKVRNKYKFNTKNFKNIKLFNLKNTQEFINFCKNKKVLVINCFGKTYEELKIHLLLKKLNLNQIQITTTGNEQYSNTTSNKFLKQKINYLIKKRFFYFFTNILSFLNIINKIDARFISNKNIITYINKSWFKKFLYEKQFFFAKKLFLVNSIAYDNSIINKDKISQDFIVHIDTSLNYFNKTVIRGKLPENSVKKHYLYLNIFLEKISKHLKKKVIVCIHPAYDMNLHKKYLRNFKVYKFKTREFIRKAYLVSFFDSTTILDAVLLNKRIVGLVSKFSSDNDIKRQNAWSNNIKCVKQILSDPFVYNRKEINKLKLYKKNNYKKYIETYLKRKSNKLGIQEIVEYIKIYFNYDK